MRNPAGNRSSDWPRALQACPSRIFAACRRSARAASWQSRDARRRAAAPARRSRRGLTGTRPAARSASARAECTGCRRPDRCRRARRTWSRAGSTSATLAVSVMNCSCTHTNRSSRAKPRLTISWSGATATGLVFWMSSAVTGGRRAARPRRRSGSRRCATGRACGSRDRARPRLRSSFCRSGRSPLLL